VPVVVKELDIVEGFFVDIVFVVFRINDRVAPVEGLAYSISK
jgi:hypothetical protein